MTGLSYRAQVHQTVNIRSKRTAVATRRRTTDNVFSAGSGSPRFLKTSLRIARVQMKTPPSATSREQRIPYSAPHLWEHDGTVVQSGPAADSGSRITSNRPVPYTNPRRRRRPLRTERTLEQRRHTTTYPVSPRACGHSPVTIEIRRECSESRLLQPEGRDVVVRDGVVVCQNAELVVPQRNGGDTLGE